ncbi:hypothetical protein M427DRAFT_488341 [Gonapodya prolifera JEL478]|uniref:ODAD1 central coiled coil region domain-containing protein n=1 Tax=Gonapodya prolifera (strain JEL478) TaxID=1344416 RepID=A0A139APT4_GONPJ|nr:hypothetical protein M427DRAFT_488341 [Gonapodya prolifera JEL478]|eukprot:KXS18767.1 hypothetical protein M427DRAFT_488341 [Gonapodya prolifera JEL478]
MSDPLEASAQVEIEQHHVRGKSFESVKGFNPFAEEYSHYPTTPPAHHSVDPSIIHMSSSLPQSNYAAPEGLDVPRTGPSPTLGCGRYGFGPRQYSEPLLVKDEDKEGIEIVERSMSGSSQLKEKRDTVKDVFQGGSKAVGELGEMLTGSASKEDALRVPKATTAILPLWVERIDSPLCDDRGTYQPPMPRMGSPRPKSSARLGSPAHSDIYGTSNGQQGDTDGADPGIAEIELAKLQRQFRLMEGDRRAYSDESRIVIARQRTALETLRRDNNQLRDEARLLRARSAVGRGASAGRGVGKEGRRAEELKEMEENLLLKIRKLQTRLGAISSETTLLDRARRPARSAPPSMTSVTTSPASAGAAGGTNGKPPSASPSSGGIPHLLQSPAATQASPAHQTPPDPKQVFSLESRLEKALVKYNTSLLRLRQLRRAVDALRFERGMFDRVAGRVERDVQGCKRRMAEVVEESGQAYESRDDSQSKLLALKEKSDKEHQAYLSEMKELDRILEQDRKLKEFMAAKTGESRASRGRMGTKSAPARAGGGRSKGAPGLTMSTVEGAGLKSASPSASSADPTSSLNGAPSATAAALSRTWGANTATMSATQLLAYYHDVWKEVGEVLGMDVDISPGQAGVEKIIEKISSVEGENFSLFNFVTEINNEVEVANEEIATLQAKISELQKEGEAEEKETMRRVKILENTLGDLSTRRAHYESELTQFHMDLAYLRDHAALALGKLAELGPILSVFGLGSSGSGTSVGTQQAKDRQQREKQREIKSVLVHTPRKEVGVLELPDVPVVDGKPRDASSGEGEIKDKDQLSAPSSRPNTAPSTEEMGGQAATSRPGSAGSKPRAKSARKALRFSMDVANPAVSGSAGTPRGSGVHLLGSQSVLDGSTDTDVNSSTLASIGKTDSELVGLLSQVADIASVGQTKPTSARPHDTPTKPQDPAAFTSQALAYLEKRTTDLLLLNFLVASLTRKPAAENVTAVDGVVAGGAPTDSMLGMGPAAPVGTLVVEVPPSDDRDSDGEGQEERPLTREELKSRTAKEVIRLALTVPVAF